MKKNILLIPFLLLFLISSCKETVNLQELNIQTDDPESKIGELEKSGVQLFKRNLKIADETGKNFVIVQVASEEESKLNEYLLNTKFKLVLDPQFTSTLTSNNDTKIQPLPPSAQIDIYDVVLFKQIDSKYKTYTIKYQHNVQKNARFLNISSFSYNSWHESNRFDDWMRVDWFTVGNNNEGISIDWEYKDCAFCSWTDDYNMGLHAENPTAIYEKDARRLGCRIHHNYYNYNVSYGNY